MKNLLKIIWLRRNLLAQVSLRRTNPSGLLSVEAHAAWPRYAVTKMLLKQFA